MTMSTRRSVLGSASIRACTSSPCWKRSSSGLFTGFQWRQSAEDARRADSRPAASLRRRTYGAPGSTPPGSRTCRNRKRGVLYQDSSNLLQAAINGQGIALVRRSLAMPEVAGGPPGTTIRHRRPSPWQYFFICPPAMLQTDKVRAFRDWVFDEVGRFRLLFEQACAAESRRIARRANAQSTILTIGWLVSAR